MKILVLGLAKSGTTALAYRLRDALGEGAELEFEPGKTAGAEDSELHRRITARTGDGVTKNLVFPTTETRWERIFDNADRYDRAVWIVRDPRDIIISNFFYHWFQGHRASPERYRLALERTREKERNPGALPFIDLVSGTMTDNRAQLEAWQRSWYEILVEAAPGITRHLHVLKYEDLVDERLEELSAYLGIALTGAREIPDEHRRVVRTRAYGNWRRWFTEDDVEFFRPVLGEFLRGMGYDADDWTLQPVEQLPAAEGSGYMESLRSRGGSKSPVTKLAERARRTLRRLLPRRS